MARLECKNISKSFGSIVALEDVSIQIEPGEVRALFGGNGSGKSTLAKIVGGFVKPSAGEMLLDGKKITFDTPTKAKKSHVIITAQELSLFQNVSVEENILISCLPTKCGRIDRKELRHVAMAALEKVHLADIIDKTVDELSINQKYMVEFAKALVQKPSILILDEITSALYREEVATVSEVIKELKKNGCCVIFVSHRMPEIYAMCDTVTVLRSGHLVGTYLTAEKTKNELLSLMTGRDITDVDIVDTVRGEANRKVAMKVEGLDLLSRKTRVSLDVYEGEVIGVAGLQGNGQSELVREMFAVDEPVVCELYGKMRKLKNPADAVRNGIAFISGERELEGTYANRSIIENVGAISDLVLNQKKTLEYKLDILKKYNVVMGSERQQLQTLSGGNQQKVVMARWTSMNPKVVLADDPTKGIDVNARRDVHVLLRELTQNGSAVVFVSSDDEELVELTRSVPFSRVIVMYDGGIAQTLYGDNITTENIAAYAMPKGVDVNNA